MEAIQLLEETVKVLENTANKDKVEKNTIEIQTVTLRRIPSGAINVIILKKI